MIEESSRVTFDGLLRDSYQEKFLEFLAETKNRSPVLRVLLEKIEKMGIELAPSEFFREFFDGAYIQDLGYGSFPQIGKPHIITISTEINKRRTVSEVEIGLAHEIGHSIVHEKLPCMSGELQLSPFPYYPALGCLFEETRADEEALKILSDICDGINNWRIDDCDSKESLAEVVSYRMGLGDHDYRDICRSRSTCPRYEARQRSEERINKFIAI